MTIIDKYFSKQLLGVFTLLLLVLTGLAWMVQIISTMKFLMNYGVNLGSFLGLSAMMIPFIVSIILPFIAFISVLFVYNKMISDNEIVVMMASGCSPKNIARPALTLAAILTGLHFLLNLWIVPMTQAKFYDTQWNLRYGLAHLKLQEASFTELTHGLVVYVDKVSGHSLKQIMLSDNRNNDAKFIVFADQGELVATVRGLSIVMTKGSLQADAKSSIIGNFDTFDMDLSLNEQNDNSTFRVRRLPTKQLVNSLFEKKAVRQHQSIATELSTRFLGPLMNFILVILCLTILLRSSLLRRRTSFAPVISVVSMSVIMATFMSLSNMLTGGRDLLLLAAGLCITTIIIVGFLFKK